jgi:putative molybdopterin biosynthesis protein
MAAVPLPSACLALPVSSGLCLSRRDSSARISTPLLDNEIEKTLIIAGCDPAVSMLIAWMVREGSQINPIALPCSSRKSLAALADGFVHVAGVHLRDPKSGDYNLTPVRDAVGSNSICLVNFARWEVGFATARGNPRGIRDLTDFARPDVTIVNRERGADARQVPDEALAQVRLNHSQVKGYENEAGGHLEVAAVVQRGEADSGVTIRIAAEAYGLGFIALREERYDLAINESELGGTPVSRMLDAIDWRGFGREVAQLCAYDTTQMGEEVARINC